MATATATIDLNAIRHNWQKLRSMSSKDSGAVVKANAYGLGLKQVAKALYDEGARIFFVATAEEGAELRSKPFDEPRYSLGVSYRQGRVRKDAVRHRSGFAAIVRGNRQASLQQTDCFSTGATSW